jgi:hypothetical protein
LKQLARFGTPKLVGELRGYVYPQLRSNPAAGANIKRLKGKYPNTWMERCFNVASFVFMLRRRLSFRYYSFRGPPFRATGSRF